MSVPSISASPLFFPFFWAKFVFPDFVFSGFGCVIRCVLCCDLGDFARDLEQLFEELPQNCKHKAEHKKIALNEEQKIYAR